MKFLEFAALIASASAISINSEIYPHPDYYEDGYSNTWKYTEMTHIVNETAYVNDVPAFAIADPDIFDEGSFAGSGSSDNVLVQENEETLVYLKEQHKMAKNQQLLDQIMLEDKWTLN